MYGMSVVTTWLENDRYGECTDSDLDFQVGSHFVNNGVPDDAPQLGVMLPTTNMATGGAGGRDCYTVLFCWAKSCHREWEMYSNLLMLPVDWLVYIYIWDSLY